PSEAGAQVRAGEHLQDVHVLEVERDAALGPVELEADRVLATGGEAGRLEGRKGTTAQAGEEDRRVVDGDLAQLARARRRRGQPTARLGQGPLLDEGLRHRAHPRQVLTGDELHQVDDVGPDVAKGAGTG